MELNPLKQQKIEHKIPVEKKQEYKLIGNTVKKKGHNLYALNSDNNRVYKVQIEKIDIIDFGKKKASTHKAKINPNHKMLFALNLKNAERKFKKLI